MSYDYKIAKDVLSDNDKNRLVCLFLSCDSSAINACIDWEKATAMFDCASVVSMKVMKNSCLKKIEQAGGKEGVDASPEKVAKGGGKKRKGKADGNDDEEVAEAPKKKGKARSKKKAATPVADDDAAAADTVKAEEEE